LKNSFYFGKRCPNVSAKPAAKTISNTADIDRTIKRNGLGDGNLNPTFPELPFIGKSLQ
jgi:hypothetical protein